jgi:hypothetical protein
MARSQEVSTFLVRSVPGRMSGVCSSNRLFEFCAYLSAVAECLILTDIGCSSKCLLLLGRHITNSMDQTP